MELTDALPLASLDITLVSFTQKKKLARLIYRLILKWHLILNLRCLQTSFTCIPGGYFLIRASCGRATSQGMVLRDFCLKQGFDFITVLNRVSFLGESLKRGMILGS